MNTERIIAIGTQIWNSLTEDEQDHIIVYDGTLGFVEALFTLLGYDRMNQVITVHNEIFKTDSDNPESIITKLQTKFKNKI